MPLTNAEANNLEQLLAIALPEDLGAEGDITSRCTIADGRLGQAAFVARVPGVVAGMTAVKRVAELVDPKLRVTVLVTDGQEFLPGMVLATIAGPMRSLLTAERTALNFLQRLSGVASLTRDYVKLVAHSKAKVLDTRKTTPGWRLLEKYAVRMGGGHNHRIGLYDAILIKDNHLAAIRDNFPGQDDVVLAVQQARAMFPGREIEIEVDSLAQFERALGVRPEIVLLDNMGPALLHEAVGLRDRLAPGVLLEASGGVNLTTIKGIAETGIDRISIGAITHSAKAVDIGLDYQSK